jgi:hemerythrin
MKCKTQNLEWNPQMETGLIDIDRQHQFLLSMLNDLANEPGITVNSERFTNLLLKFSKAVEKHFEFEELLLEKLGYDKLDDHKFEHDEILIQLADVAMSSVKMQESAILQFIETLCVWFDHHLQQEDAEYFNLLKNAYIGPVET